MPLLLVAMPGAPSSDALAPSSFLFLVAIPTYTWLESPEPQE